MFDGVLADFNLAYGRLFIKTTGRNLFPADWEIQLKAEQFPTTWNWEKDWGYTAEESSKVWRIITKDDQFWGSLDALPMAKDAIYKLNHMAKAGDDIYFLTNRMGYKAKIQTEAWLYGLGMDYPAVLLCADKFPVLKALNINFFIDDKTDTLLDVAEKLPQIDQTQAPFYLFCRDAAYNRVPYPEAVKTVKTVMEALEWVK